MVALLLAVNLGAEVPDGRRSLYDQVHTMTPTSAADLRTSVPWRDRLLALLLRPTPPPLIWGVVTAVAFIAVETLIVHVLKQVAPDNAFGAIFLPHWPACA